MSNNFEKFQSWIKENPEFGSFQGGEIETHPKGSFLHHPDGQGILALRLDDGEIAYFDAGFNGKIRREDFMYLRSPSI